MDTDKLVLDNLYAVLMACNRADTLTMESDTAETIQKLLLADCTSAEDATAVRNSVVRLLGEQKKAAYEYATLREERSVQLEYWTIILSVITGAIDNYMWKKGWMY